MLGVSRRSVLVSARALAGRSVGKNAVAGASVVRNVRFYNSYREREENAKRHKAGILIAGAAVLGAVLFVSPPGIRQKFFPKKKAVEEPKVDEGESEANVAGGEEPEPVQEEEEQQQQQQETKSEDAAKLDAEDDKSDVDSGILSSDFEEISSDEKQSDDDVLSSDFEEVMDSVSETDKENLQLTGEKGKTAESMPLNDEKDMGAVEDEVKQESAYNPDTGEINWDCPCLGGMAHGPCGEEFKEAFACFVYSEADPKGIDCVEKFQHMQDCFRKYPEHYAEQLADPNEEEKADYEENLSDNKDKKAKPDAEKSAVSSEIPSEKSEAKTDAAVQETKEN